MDSLDHFDVIIVGSGISGLSVALNLKPSVKALIVAKKSFFLCNTSLAQGGIAAVYNFKNDNHNKHIKDTLVAGHNKNRIDAVRLLSQNSKDAIDDLVSLGVEFDTDDTGNYQMGLEGGHSEPRIFHHKDSSGNEIQKKLTDQCSKRKNIVMLEYTQLSDIKFINSEYKLEFLKQNCGLYHASCTYLVIATGGIGRIYPYTTNSSISTGDGIAFAWRLGAKIKNISYIQFHPTAFQNNSRESFLISEAVRGDGAYLLNCNMQRFMQKYDDRLELAPRDVVSRAILKEQKLIGSSKFYLDISHKDSNLIKSRFPMITDKLKEYGYDITKQPIPIYPSQHYLMGGIDVDLNSQSTLPGLFAVGECSHTGVHGKNRLASNSLLEGYVFAKRAALFINDNLKPIKKESNIYEFPKNTGNEPLPIGIRTEIRKILYESTFVTTNKNKIQTGFLKLKDIMTMLEDDNFKISQDLIEARSLAICGYLILKELMDKYIKKEF